MQSSTTFEQGQRGKRSRTADGGDNQEWSKQRKRTKRSRLSKNGKESFEQQPTGEAHVEEDAVGTSLIGTTELKQQNPKQLHKTSEWSLSRASGGRFTNMNPIFTPDGQYIILGLETAVHIFSISTSRLIRALETKKRQQVTSYKLSQCNPAHLYISTTSGNITKWDWGSGQRIRSWETSNHTFDFDIALREAGGSAKDTLLLLHEHGNGQRAISLSNPEPKTGSRRLDRNLILETTSRIEAIQLVDNGRVLVVRAGEKLLVGTTSRLGDDDFAAVNYIWREIELPVFATCFDIRERAPSNLPTSSQPLTRSQSSIVDVVVGESLGSLLIYNDILNTLDRIEDTHEIEAKTGLISSRLHWHRNAVRTVRWSKDGNYIISGGLETVLVLWQLDTGRKQFLPHLSSQICNITVSPMGDSYAVKLADNSVMVLSTTELQPFASISGLQLSSVETGGAKFPSKDAADKLTNGSNAMNLLHFPPAILHPLKPSRLLLAASTQLASVENPHSYNILQTFDIETYHQVSRQALARTNSTVVNTAPDGSEITTPDIKHITITGDGRWLATVDEWMSRPQNTRPLHVNHVEFGRDVESNREIFLKFWEWNEGTGEWELVTRIDAPHYEASVGSTSVLDLVANPGSSEFASIGRDGVVRFWTCGTRYRRENKTRASEGDRQLKTWRCRNTVSLEGSSTTPGVDSNRGCLSFSEDGSVLAVCWKGGSNKAGRLVYLIDPQTCELRHVRDGICEGTPHGVGFLGRDLIVLSDRIVVWDTVDDKLKLNTSLLKATADDSSDRHRPLLSINSRSNTFVVSFANFTRKSAPSRIQAFSTQSIEPLFETGLRDRPHAILADPMSGDHIILDSAAQVRRLGCDQSTLTAHTIPEISSLTSGLGNVFGNPSLNNTPPLSNPSKKESQTTKAKEHVQALDDDGDKLSTKKLSRVFDSASGFTLPAIGILFEDMMSLFKN